MSDLELEHDSPATAVDLVANGVLSDAERSLWDQLAEAREEIAKERETFILIPGYKGLDMYARYRLIEGKELEGIARKMSSKEGRRGGHLWEKNLNAAMDTMALACTGIFYQTDDDKEPQPLTIGGEPVLNYGDPKLPMGLKMDPSINSARKVIFQMFGGKDLVISDHAMKLNRFFTGANLEVDDEFMGEDL